MHGLVLVGAEVFGDLADGKAGDEAAQHRAEQPQRLSLDRLGVPDEEQAEDHDDLDAGGHVRAAIESLVQRGAFLGAHGEQADDGREDAAARDDDGGDQRPHQVARGEVAAQRAERGREDGGSQDGTGVGLEQVGAHARDVAHVVAHVVGDGGRVARVVLRNARFDLAHEVGSHVGRLRVDAAAHTGEQSHSRSTGGEALHHADVLMHLRDFDDVDAEHQQEQPQRQAQQRERSNAQAHGQAGLEADVQSLGNRLLGGMRRARVGARGDVHAGVARGSRHHAARGERERRDGRQGDRHDDADDHHEDDEQLVLAHEERLGALLDLDGDAVHLVRTRILLQNPGTEVGRHANADQGTHGSHPCDCSSHVSPPFSVPIQ